MTTKEKIQLTALQLFNEQGIHSVTTRHIAAQMGISHGNLCYHFPNREAIIEQLYRKLVAELDAVILQAVPTNQGLSLLFKLTHQTFTIQYKYRFILLHMVEIMRKISAIGQHFRQLLIQRRGQIGLIIEHLISQNIFQPEPFPGQYQRLITQFYIIGDFWLSEAEILFEGTEEEKVKYYAQIAQSMIIPYLTESGKDQFRHLQAMELID